MKVLVTGATGFVGAHVAAGLVAEGYEVLALHRGQVPEAVRRGMEADGSAAPLFVAADVRDGDGLLRLMATHRPSLVVHAAAVTPDADTERVRADRVVATNVAGTAAVLTAAARHGVERVVVFSSAAVYGPAESTEPVEEDSALCSACSLYAVTKLASEHLCRWARQQLGVDVRSLRLGPVYGAFERPTRSRTTMSLVYQAVHLALAGTPLRSNAPAAIRDWIHGRDVASAVAALAATPALRHDVYNLAGPAVTVAELLDIVAAVLPGTQVQWVDSPAAANLPIPTTAIRGPLSTRRLQQDTGFRPAITIERGIRAYVAALRAAGGA